MKIEIPEKYRIKILDVMCACEDDMERVDFCWQFAQNLHKELKEENDLLKEDILRERAQTWEYTSVKEENEKLKKGLAYIEGYDHSNNNPNTYADIIIHLRKKAELTLFNTEENL